MRIVYFLRVEVEADEDDANNITLDLEEAPYTGYGDVEEARVLTYFKADEVIPGLIKTQ